MDPVLMLAVFEKGVASFTTEFEGPVELGRRQRGEARPFSCVETPASGMARIVLAERDEASISRRQARIDPLAGGRVRLTNLSTKQPILLADGTSLAPQASCELVLPSRFRLGAKQIHLAAREDGDEDTCLEVLGGQTIASGIGGARTARFTTVPLGQGVDTESMVRWLQGALEVLQSATTSKVFFERAARAVIDVAGLDFGAVLMFGEGGWKSAADACTPPFEGTVAPRPSRRVLDQVLERKRTVWIRPRLGGDLTESLSGVRTAVAAPILSPAGQVIGALYGDCRSGHSDLTISQPEALVVDLLAGSVAAGLARLEQEQAAIAARLRFEQFFSPELSRVLEAQPDLLEGRDAEVSILFADIRGFSRISARLGPERAFDWIRETMTALSACVADHAGVVVDFVGDELMAMWGAPEQQPDHPRRACAAAIAMLGQLPSLNERWETLLQEPIELGIGVNTGTARVGNTGSERRLHYGPLGNTVNVASRVRGTAKYLGASIVAAGSTIERLGSGFDARRLGWARLVNIAEPVELFELGAADGSTFAPIRDLYDRALDDFEKGRLSEASRVLGRILSERPDDGPSLLLMSRTIQALMRPAAFDPVWEVPGK